MAECSQHLFDRQYNLAIEGNICTTNSTSANSDPDVFIAVNLYARENRLVAPPHPTPTLGHFTPTIPSGVYPSMLRDR